MRNATEHFMVNNKKAYNAKYRSENRKKKKKKKKNGSKNRDFDCSRLWHDNRDCAIDRLSMPTLTQCNANNKNSPFSRSHPLILFLLCEQSVSGAENRSGAGQKSGERERSGERV